MSQLDSIFAKFWAKLEARQQHTHLKYSQTSESRDSGLSREPTSCTTKAKETMLNTTSRAQESESKIRDLSGPSQGLNRSSKMVHTALETHGDTSARALH
ncbi:Hypothetical predicted protein [Pelobates cultripes]|uniref:Uncharacterized protein n=1 Tax=Pelobates cultripes TaxID=61616 RepID=A0AAD1VV55_PELCU|nr:Hypothetical predicted protein [Pelobates cultripes]